MIERFHHVYYADEQNAIIVVCRGRGSPDLFLQPKKKKKKKVQVFTAGFCYGILTTDRWIQRGAKRDQVLFFNVRSPLWHLNCRPEESGPYEGGAILQ